MFAKEFNICRRSFLSLEEVIDDIENPNTSSDVKSYRGLIKSCVKVMQSIILYSTMDEVFCIRILSLKGTESNIS